MDQKYHDQVQGRHLQVVALFPQRGVPGSQVQVPGDPGERGLRGRDPERPPEVSQEGSGRSLRAGGGLTGCDRRESEVPGSKPRLCNKNSFLSHFKDI